ncbi:MAG: O-sialoglycoprotein endopeptidase [Clostridiales bacterium]|nr:O-sialoglycoprotein endopeptidase [Clostridiales bacterium]
MKVILGFDTSCYTTSMAMVDLERNLIFSNQTLLKVDKGNRGLSQSKALFQHLHNLPHITELISQAGQNLDIVAICSSIKPRPSKDSYMPVFKVSSLIGKSMANLLKVPFYETSHQEGHIMAGLSSVEGLNDDRFLAIQLSGGTTEMLEVQRKGTGFDISIIGWTQDLHAGQFVDRVGVALGLPFPAGPALERLALEGQQGKIIIPSFARGMEVGFSGAETHALRLREKGENPEDIALAVFMCLVKTLEKWIRRATEKTKIKDILLVGGVASNSIVRRHLESRISKYDRSINLYYAQPSLSKDNAVGVALLGLEKYQAGHDL